MDSEGLRDVFKVEATGAKLNRLSRHGLMQIHWAFSVGLQAQRVSVGRPIAKLP